MKYEYWFAKIQGINLRKKIRLRQCMKTAEAIYYIEETQLKKIEFLNESEQDKILKAKRQDPEKEYESLCEKGIRFIPHFTDEYPEKLKRISDYPYALYVKGSLPDKAAKKAALVGARRCTPYGEKYAVDFGKVLAEHGVQIISGLSDVVLVMEAGEKSGSLITVDLALEQGREVYALPGPVNSRMSIGCNELIRQGAGILLSPEMFLEELGLSGKKTEKEGKNKKMLETQEELLYSCLGLYPKSVEEILKETKLEVRQVMEILVSLELRGYIREISKNHYIIV